MYLSKSLTLSLVGAASTVAFAPSSHRRTARSAPAPPLHGYLDDLTDDLNAVDDSPVPLEQSREANKMDKSLIQNAGPGTFADFVDFGEEFDGGDGQMGVAGDGSSGLDKMDNTPQMAKSKTMSAKNAWGTSSGYADKLLDENPAMDTSRAQQLENWANQQEVRAKNVALKEMAENFDAVVSSEEEDWRQLAKFGVERNEEFDMDAAFGPVAGGTDIEGTIELKTAINRVATHDIHLRNPFMGFADFRAALTADTPMDWTIEPNEGSLMQREDTHFTLKFKPQGPGLIQGTLVIETEDFKKTWKIQGST